MMVFSHKAFAIDLFSLYLEAQCNDSTLQSAKESQLAAREALPLARAQFLPVMDFQATYLAQHSTSRDIGSFHTNTLNLTLTQPVIHFEHWRKYAQASNAVKSANASYTAAEQDLIIRLAQAYFGVLQAIDALYYARSSVQAFANFLEQTEQRFNVGLIAITDVEIARAQHDNALALAIAAENEVNNQREKLRTITGRTIAHISPLKDEFPLTSPCPKNVEEWVSTALAQNFQLQAGRYSALAAKNQIKVDHYAHLPTVDIIGQVERSSLLVTLPGPQVTDSNIGVQVNFPISRGGGFVAKTRQSIHNYLKTDRDVETLYRNVESATRQAYRTVLTQINQVRALKQAMISNQSALAATHASFNVGARTIVDVLNAQTDLIRVQQSYVTARYSYIVQSLILKQASGILCAEDLLVINQWLMNKKTSDEFVDGAAWIEKELARSKRKSKKDSKLLTQEREILKTGKPMLKPGKPIIKQGAEQKQTSGEINPNEKAAPGENISNESPESIRISNQIKNEVKTMEKAYPEEEIKNKTAPEIIKTGPPEIHTGKPEIHREKVTIQKGRPLERVEPLPPTPRGISPAPRTPTAPVPTIAPSIPVEPVKSPELPSRNLPNTDQFNRPTPHSPGSTLEKQENLGNNEIFKNNNDLEEAQHLMSNLEHNDLQNNVNALKFPQQIAETTDLYETLQANVE